MNCVNGYPVLLSLLFSFFSFFLLCFFFSFVLFSPVSFFFFLFSYYFSLSLFSLFSHFLSFSLSLFSLFSLSLFSLFSLSLFLSFSVSHSLSLSFFSSVYSLLSLLSSLPLFLLSSLLATKHYGKNRSTNKAAKIEAFACDLAQGQLHSSRFSPSSSPLPPPFSPLPSSKKEEGTFYYRNISGEGINLCYSFIIIPEKSAAGRNYRH